MTSPHVFHLSAQTPHNISEGGFRIKADKESFPALKGMSLYKLVLHPNGIREPHWHPNADELGYCLSGQVLVTFYSTDDNKQTFVVNAGETFFIPSGALHAIVNIGDGDAELILQFSNEHPEEFGVSTSIGMFTDTVLGNTWGVNAGYFSFLKRPLTDQFAVLANASEIVPSESYYKNPYHYDLEGSQPILDHQGGSARMARENLWPILKQQALYSLILTDTGMREPHWHPETGEMGYVHKGKGRMSILSPSGTIDTYELNPGDLYYIPKAYPHHIENIGTGDLHFLIFFDQSMPKDIGFTGSIRSLSDHILGSVLSVKPSFIEGLNKYYADQFIVNKINPSE